MAERVGVLVKDGSVCNVILWSDETFNQLKNEYEHLEETTGFVIQPRLGWTWSKKDGYRPPQPYQSWSWSNDDWQPPTPMPEPTDLNNPEPYDWDEEALSWIVPQWWLDQQEEETEPEV